MDGAVRRVLAALGGCAGLLLAGCGGGTPSTPDPMTLQKADIAAFNGHGSWWNPAEPGTGFFFEAQGGTGVVTFYVFDSLGRPTWVSAAGSMVAADGGHRFEGTLQRYTGGQALTSLSTRTPVATPVGNVTIRFTGDSAQVTLPKRSFTARKFSTVAPAVTGLQPETGIYWNPDQSGRGYTLEMIGNSASLTMFHYDNQGEPTWHLVVAPLYSGAFSGGFLRYGGGQTLDGPYRAPLLPQLDGALAASVQQPCTASIWLPTMGTLPIRRFAFGSLPAGAECRTGARTAAQGAAVAGQQTALAGTAAGLVRPAAVVVDAAGVSYVADEGAHVIWRIAADGSTSVLAGRVGESAFFDGPGSSARFHSPGGITLDANGVLYVSDTGNHAIRRITAGGAVSTVAGRPGQASVVNGTLLEARFNRPGRMRADAQGNLFVAEGGGIRKIGTDGRVTTFAGGAAVSTRVIADAADSAFYIVQGLTFDSQGNLWVVETDAAGQSWIRKFAADGRQLRLANAADGTWPMPYATDLAVDANGNAYVAVAGTPSNLELTYQGVYKLDPNGVMTLYGGAVAPSYDVPGGVPRLMGGASGLAFDPSAATGARLLVADRSGILWQLRP